MKTTKTKFLHSVVALLACFALFVGSTFAWFTDSVSSMNNIITSGNLDLEMYWTDDLNGTWHNVEEDAYNTIFSYDNWEPGYTEVKYIKLVNAGSLALNYELAITPQGAVGKLAEVINVYFASEAVVLDDRDDLSQLGAVGLLSYIMDGNVTAGGTLLAADQYSPLGHPSGEVILTVAMNMLTTAGNEYQDETAGNFSITALATQAPYEEDGFGSDYDVDAELPELILPTKLTAAVTPVDGKVPAGGVTMAGSGVSATLPEGTKLVDGTDKVTLTITPLETSTSGITVVNQEILIPVDIHIDGVAADNTVPIIIDLGAVLPKYLNIGNYSLVHVEDGGNQVMTRVANKTALTAHNQFAYVPETGEVTVAMASFSEVALTADTASTWEGNYDASWFVAGQENYTISNADQLAAFGAIVGGMKIPTTEGTEAYFAYTDSSDSSVHNYTFGGATVKLITDINLADGETDRSTRGNIFYPIGYYNSDYTYEKTNKGITSGFRNFEGTFDGNGHTIKNFYHNTWEMKGDHEWYAPEDQYYRDGMGLFGRVYGGTVKNLTVSNFTSDGEITTTGVIAAYADCGATFENIAITDCNPRVYNIGNGGIVGCVGWYAKKVTDEKVTFSNITVDNSNKISALWGSYDVACGGIVGQYYPTSGQSSADYPVNAGIHFENCHVSAVMDVYNDVCANYQYYAYRYTGMMIGSIRENETIDGHVYPKMDGITASGCTVNFGDWNDYYYCELVANSLASYTHDHQFSRLEQVAKVEGTTITPLEGEAFTVPSSGRYNYVVVNEKNSDGTFNHATENATCYHFVDGKVHDHDDYNGDGVDDYETVNGQKILVENNRHIYLEFNNLFTGYGWGVTSKGISDFDGVEIQLGKFEESVTKFEKADTAAASYTTGTTVTIGELFAAIDNAGVPILSDKVQVTVSPVGDTSTAGGTYVPDAGDWTQGSLTFSGAGGAIITITDYYFCTPTTISVGIDTADKFATKFTNENFTYRVGNATNSPVTLGTLFKVIDGESVDSATVDVTIVPGEGTANGTFASNSTAWASGKVQFSGNGKVDVIISAENVTPVQLTLEVVDAVNATSATNATGNNVVLLQDCGFSSLTVSNGYTLYGNGFTMTCGSDSYAADLGYAFVTLENGTLDNVQIVCPNFDFAALYKSNLTDSANRIYKSGEKTYYYNARSAVMASGNSQILNSRISGARAAVYATNGNLVLDNSRIELGAAANIHVGAAVTGLTLKDVTLVQMPTESTYVESGAASGTTLMGISVIAMADSSGNTAPITIDGSLKQYSWACEEYKSYVPEKGQALVSTVLGKDDYIHSIRYQDGTQKDSVNLGIVYMPDESSVNQPTINDKRSNHGYDWVTITQYGISTYVYTIKNTAAVDDLHMDSVSEYKPNKQGDISPALEFGDVNADRVWSSTYDTEKGWVYKLTINLDNGAYTFDFSALVMTKAGSVQSYSLPAGVASTIAVEEGTTEYELTATIDGKDYTVYFQLIGSASSKEPPKWSSDAEGSSLSTTMNADFEAGVCVSTGNSSTWSGAAPALANVYVRYYSTEAKDYKVINLADYTPTTKGTFDGTDTTCTISGSDFTLTLTGGQVHSSNKISAMPVVIQDGSTYTLYFVASSSSGLVNSGNSARTVPVTYSFTDNLGNTLAGSYTWSVTEVKSEAYNYAKFCEGTLEKNSCLTPDTLITLADGTQKRVDQLTGDELLLVWNLETGKYDVAPIVFVDTETEMEYEIIHLYFSDGSDVKVISEHGFFDLDLGKYVYIDATNYADYIGHRFVAEGDIAANNWNVVTLDEVVLEYEVTTAWSPVTFEHLCYYTNGVLSMPGGIAGLFNIFEVDTDTMRYDEEQMQKDIETYGLFTLEDFGGMIPEIAFEAFNGDYLKVAMGKGLITWEEIAYLAERYIPLM